MANGIVRSLLLLSDIETRNTRFGDIRPQRVAQLDDFSSATPNLFSSILGLPSSTMSAEKLESRIRVQPGNESSGHVCVTARYLSLYSISMAGVMRAACQINNEYLIPPTITVTRGVPADRYRADRNRSFKARAPLPAHGSGIVRQLAPRNGRASISAALHPPNN